MIRRGNLQAEKVRMADDNSVWCSLWSLFPSENVATGLGFDFHAEDIDDLILLLQELKEEEAELFEPE